MEILALLLLVGAALVNLVCFIWVEIEMAREKGILWAILGFFCCNLIPFIWGWTQWQSDKKMPVMITWSLSILITFIGYAIVGAAAAASQGAASGGGF